MSNILVFENKELAVIKDDQGDWLTIEALAEALGYNDKESIRRLYNRNKKSFKGRDELTAPYTKIIQLQTAGGIQESRVFSLRGALLLGMFARTEIGDCFREFILDILTGEKPLLSPQYSYLKGYFYEKEPKAKAYLKYNQMGLSDEEIARLLKINMVQLQTIKSSLESIGEVIKDNVPVYEEVVRSGNYRASDYLSIPTVSLQDVT